METAKPDSAGVGGAPRTNPIDRRVALDMVSEEVVSTLAIPECVHCGFCLPVCPTYDVLGTEMDNPRGRLYLMRALEEGRLAPTEPLVRHLDLCLGCRACESECPSGVPYGHHLEKARATLRTAAVRPRGQRIVESLLLRAVALPPSVQLVGAAVLTALHRVLRAVAETSAREGIAPRGGQREPLSRLRSGLRVIAAIEPRPASLPSTIDSRPKRGRRVGILEGCVNRCVFGHVNEAAARLLAASGCEVLAPAGQRCCGALHLHSGDLEGAKRLARRNIEAFERAGDLDAIAVAAAGCGSALKEYGSLFEDDHAWAERARRFSSKAKDALELLAELGLPRPRREVRVSVAYHDACHLAHAQGIRAQPRALLAAVPGLALVPLADADRCCGGAGIYNLLHPEVASAVLAAKLERIRASGAAIVAAANPGCLMQIAAGARQAGLSIRVLHPIEILDEALNGPLASAA